MARDRRYANRSWQVVDEDGQFYTETSGAALAVLMDIRDRLDVMNRRILLVEERCSQINKIARTISRKVPARK
jgi:hypothetical protein